MSLRYRRSPAATERRVGSSLFLAHAERGSLYRLNPTVAALWHLLAEPVTREEAVSVFRQAFPDDPPDRVEEDVQTMFDDLLEEGLVEFSE
jgi:hypothetical protein